MIHVEQLDNVAVAISTTGDPWRLIWLKRSVTQWLKYVTPENIAVTVDGDETALRRVHEMLLRAPARVIKVGQPRTPDPARIREGRLGVAVNKNTGLSFLMDTGAQHLFLCDDDTAPKNIEALSLHVNHTLEHSMVCWGRSRVQSTGGVLGNKYTSWSWPRGVLIFVRRAIVERVGGFVEDFGPGGHEHVEWSRRIYQHGFTPTPFPTPAQYMWDAGTGARKFWDCEDMPKPGEPLGNTRLRKQRLTSVRRRDGDWEHIEQIMAERDGDTSFVPFRAADNGRFPATLSAYACADEPPY